MARTRYRKLMLIGNGFDRWQGLPTSYDAFRNYYKEHIGQAMERLGIPLVTVPQPDGSARTVTPVDLVYGNPFEPGELPPDFFWTFETSLDRLDDQMLLFYFGRSRAGRHQLRKTVSQARVLLRRLFSDWVRALDIEPQEGGYRFGDDCFFVSFNYTDTLEKRFGVPKRNIFHIHGEAARPRSMVFGHATHPKTAFRELQEQNFIRSAVPGKGLPRLKGLYALEDALYRTDKHVADHIDAMCLAFMEAGVHIEEIEDIYVLGQSFGEPDVEYFDYLNRATRCGADYDALSAAARLDRRALAMLQSAHGEEFLLWMIQLNLQYAIHHRESKLQKKPLCFSTQHEIERLLLRHERPFRGKAAKKAAWAVHQRFLMEQADRTGALLEKTAREHGLEKLPDGCRSVLSLADYLDGGHSSRRKGARWHISYFTPEDRKRIKGVMRKIGQNRFTLYEGIDRCMEACAQKIT